MPSKIRRLKKEDLPDFKKIRLESLQQSPDSFAASFEEESKAEDDIFLLGLTNGAVHGCFNGSELIGIVGFYSDSKIKCSHIANVWGVFVKQEWRGKHIGRQLMETTLEALPKNIEQVRLNVGAHNIPAKKLYNNMGFQECGLEEKVIKIGDKYYDEISMVRFIK